MAVEQVGPPVSVFHDDIGSVPPSVPTAGRLTAFADGDSPSFSDLVDLLNPLQHIPVVNTIYQELTGDHQGAVPEVVGGALWGGLIGLGAAMVNLAFEDGTGKSIGGNVVALFRGDDSDGDTAVAKADQPRGQVSAQADAEPASSGTPAVAMAPARPVPATAATLAPSGAGSDSQDGPVMAGDYLIFGGAGGGDVSRPTSLLPPAVAQAAAPTAQAAAPPAASQTPARPLTLAQAAPSDGGATDHGPRRAGDFLVFGADSPAANALPESSNDPLATAAKAVATAQPVGASPLPVPANAAPARSFPVPPRRLSMNVPQNLPPPTTGPAAVPGAGRPSMAIKPSANAANADGQLDGPGFVEAFNKAMDKYQKAARLGTIIPVAPEAGAAAGAPIPLN